MANEIELIKYAASLELKGRDSLPATRWEEAGVNFFNALAHSCHQKGAPVIGHIKGFLDLGDAGYFYLSSVGSPGGTSSRGTASGETAAGRLDLNVLVYGLDLEEVRALVATAAASLGQDLGVTYVLREARHHLHPHPAP